MEDVRCLLDQSKSGLRIHGRAQERIAAQLCQLESEMPVKKMLGLLSILDELTRLPDLETIDRLYAKNVYSNAETARFQQVFSYLIEHYRQEITLEEIAKVANLTPTSFCRYFKNMTQKTFHELVHEFRIQYACQLLRKTGAPVAQIAFDCGFGDVPYFNKLFKKQKGMSPLAYRKMD